MFYLVIGTGSSIFVRTKKRVIDSEKHSSFFRSLLFEINRRRRYTLDELYQNIKLLHAAIFTFYSKIQMQKLTETEIKELERLIFCAISGTKRYESKTASFIVACRPMGLPFFRAHFQRLRDVSPGCH